MIGLIRIAGLVHIVFVIANFILPRKLHFRQDLEKVAPIVRQIFIVHHAYIVLVVGFFGFLCLVFPGELAGSSRLGSVLCAFMAVFWLARLPIQFLVYDPEVRNRFPVEHYLFSVALASVSIVLSAAAVRGLQ